MVPRRPLPATELAERYLAGETVQALATAFGCSDWSVKHRLREQGVTLRRRGPPRTYTLNEAFFTRIRTERQAYWLGFILADGEVRRTGAGNWECRVALAASDRSQLEALRQAVGSDAPITDREELDSVSLSLHSAQLCRALLELECVPRKSGSHGTPRIPAKLRRHFYRGYFDGDGSLCCSRKNKTWRFEVIGSQPFIRELQRWLIVELGLRKTKLARSKTSPQMYYVRYNGGRQVERICKLLYTRATVYLPRKFCRYQNLQTRRQRVHGGVCL